MTGRRRPRYPGGGGRQGPDEEALLSDAEVQRRINLEGGGHLVPPPPEHRFRDPEPAIADPAAAPRPPRPMATGSLRSTRRARAAAGEPVAAQPPAFEESGDDAAAAGAGGAVPVATAAVATAPVAAVERRRVSEDERRRQLWRDSATILIGVVLALLLGQAVFPPATSAPIGSPTPLPSSIDIGSFGPPVSLPPGATLGPIVDPSIGIDRTPTPIPVITMGPTPTATPTAHPSPSPSKKPTPKPSVKPSTKPSVPPTEPPPTEAPTPTPPPSVSISCETPVALTVTCTRSASHIEANSEVWDMGGDGILVAGGDGSGSITWTYTSSGSYTVKITVTGLNGDTASDSTLIDA